MPMTMSKTEQLVDVKVSALYVIDHILAMRDDAYFIGHPEWEEIVNEVKELHNVILGAR